MGDKAMFLDLQGTLGGEGFGEITSFSFFPFAKEALKRMASCGYRLFIVTNQSKIAKGLITQKQFDDRAAEILAELDAEGIRIERIYCCPHQKSDLCGCRKPIPFFIGQACSEFGIDLDKSYCIGDIYHSDIEMARNAGCKAFLVLTGIGRDSLKEMEENPYEKVTVVENILEAAMILEKE